MLPHLQLNVCRRVCTLFQADAGADADERKADGV